MMPVTATEIGAIRMTLDGLGISRKDQDIFLGCASAELRGVPKHWSAVSDIEERISYLRVIGNLMSCLFADGYSLKKEMAVLWMITPRDDFGGHSALEIMRGGELDNLKFIYEKLFDELLKRRQRLDF
ncbi:MAG: hypothetical protein AAB560_02835 [Patescibacteria group bacterium]